VLRNELFKKNETDLCVVVVILLTCEIERVLRNVSRTSCRSNLAKLC